MTDLSKATKPMDDAMKLHPYYKGKIAITAKCAVRSLDDFSIWYSPGVAAVCNEIAKNKSMVYDFTNKGNMVAIVSDGSRVLGLGDIGPEAALPVMEGKALIYKYLGGVDAFPLCIDTKDPDEIVRTLEIIAPTFGGINLEDLSQPKCFDILDNAKKRLNIPVWHDDQQGTATVTLAGAINALKLTNRKMEEAKIVLFGAGAANVKIAELLILAGASPKNLLVLDSKGILGDHRTELKSSHPQKWSLAKRTNPTNIQGGPEIAFKGVDMVIALSTPGPDVIKADWIRSMNNDAIVFACANPIPEIWPWDAKKAGAKIVATGRGDFPNQVNNSIGFPAIFRGVLDVGATMISDEMCIVAAKALANFANDRGIDTENIVPRMDEWEAFPLVAAHVGTKAIEEGHARFHHSFDEIYSLAHKTIKNARESIHTLMKEHHIKPMPE